MERAYTIWHVKSVDDEQRIIRGIASTPQPDRVGDIVEPQGASFPPSIPLLLHHDQARPVGRVTLTKTARGIEFEATLPRVTDSPTLRDRIEEAWTSIKERLVGGVSIGFTAMKDAMEKLASGGTRFRAIEIVELSLVTVPANAQCTIQTIKSFDVSRPAASGTGRRIEHPTSPGASGTSAGRTTMTIQEQIGQFENTRAAKVARMATVMEAAAGEASTLDESQRQEYDGLASHVKSIDEHLVRLNEMEKLNVAKATPVVGDRSTSIPRVTLKSNLPPGTAFARYCMSVAAAKGDRWQALEYAKQWDSTTPEVSLYMKAAVAAGTTTDATWAAPLVPAAQAVMGEFLDLLRPETIIGKLTKLTKVPFNVAVSSQTGGGSYGWVGQGKVKPVSALAFAKVTLGFAKIAGIIVITDELARFSSPSAEERVRNDMIKGTAAFMDAQFIDPAVAEVVGVNPASITNGIAAIPSAGVTPAFATTDIKALIASFVTANLSLGAATLIMSQANAFALSTALNALGAPAFPNITIAGGSILGIPVVTSQAAGSMVILVDQEGILYADDGQTTVDVSREASLQMDSAPTDPVVGATVLVSLWQQNMVGLRAERYCTWKRGRTAAVAHISGAAYV